MTTTVKIENVFTGHGPIGVYRRHQGAGPSVIAHLLATVAEGETSPGVHVWEGTELVIREMAAEGAELAIPEKGAA